MLKKEYYSIKELSMICDVPDYTIRFWESQIPELKPKKISGNRRLYVENDIEFVKKINFYTKDLKISVKGIAQLIKNNGVETFISSSNLFNQYDEFENEKIVQVINKLKALKARLNGN